MSIKLACVTRTFQSGRSILDFDESIFEKGLANPVKKVLEMDAVNGPIIIILNGDLESEYSEKETDMELPSEHFIKKYFSKEIESGKIIIKRCLNWGPNPGSANALNYGDQVAIENNAELVLHWSSEIELENFLLHKAIALININLLSVIGFARENWWEKPQWFVAQNTASIWRLKILGEINGFSSKCDNFGKITDPEIIEKAKYEIGDKTISEISIAGMEDFHAMLRMMKELSNFRWGIIRDKPAKWNTDFPKDSDRGKNHLVKVFRQYYVMKEYAKSIFPEKEFKEVMNNFFGKIFIQ